MNINNAEVFEYTPNYSVKPGNTIEELIDYIGLSKAAFARHLGVSIGYLNRVISSQIPLSIEFAIKLEMVTKVPASFWNSLEANYRTQLNRLVCLAEEDRKWLRAHPCKEMLKRGWISGETEQEQFQSLLSFYRVANCKAWLEVWDTPLAAARVSPKYKVSPSAVAAFVRAGEIEAEMIHCEPYSVEKFRKVLSTSRDLVKQTMTREVLLEMRRRCAEAGVALVFVKSVNGAPLNGVTRWLSKDKAMILLSLRTMREDIIWFSFFHEAKHILDAKKKTNFLTGEAWANSPDEINADIFAADMLLSRTVNKQVCMLQTMDELKTFARDNNVSTSIVAGRIHHLTKEYTRFNKAFSFITWNDGEWKLV